MSAPPIAAGLPPALRLHQLEGFFHVATHEGFTRAAEAMPYPITEPALHQQVRKLERALGVSLLVRAPGRRMVVTPEGRALYDFVAPYFETLPGVLRDLMGGGGTLVVAAEALYVEGLCAHVLARVQRDVPDASTRLLELDLPQICQALLEGRIDLGVAAAMERVPAGLAFQSLGELGMSLLVPAGHPLAKKRPPLTAAHLAPHRYVVYEQGSEGRRYTDAVLGSAGITLAPAAEANSAAAMQSLVRAGVGPAFVPALDGAKAPKRRTLPDKTVAFNVTRLMRSVATPPGFGVFRRQQATVGRLGNRFVAIAKKRLGLG